MAHAFIHEPHIRLNSQGDLRVGHAAMTFTFEDTPHGYRAIARLQKAGIREFDITQ